MGGRIMHKVILRAFNIDAVIKNVIEELELTDQDIYRILTSSESEGKAGVFNLESKVTKMVRDKLRGKHFITPLECLDNVEMYFLKTSYKCFNADEMGEAYHYLYYDILWLTGCSYYHQVRDLSKELLEHKTILPSLFDNLFHGAIDLVNCLTVTVETDDVDEAVIIRAVRKYENYDYSKYCDYVFDQNSDENTMTINMYNK
jgi:hypothetical protein